MTNRTINPIQFSSCRKRKVQAAFDGGHVTGNGGALLLREVDNRLGLTASLARSLGDVRQPGKVLHTVRDLLRQRIFAIALGLEDLNDHTELRHDQALQTAVGRDVTLASASTLCRFEQQACEAWAWAGHEALIEVFIASHDKPPAELMLDIDATDDLVHGEQEGRGFNAYYGGYCFLPLMVFCGDHVLAACLRPGRSGQATRAAGVLKLLVARLRREWPEVRIVMRADSGFCCHRLHDWCERNGVDYIGGLAKNPRLLRDSAAVMAQAAADFKTSGEKQRRFVDLVYGAGTWKRQRRVIGRIEHNALGENPRFVVTSLEGDAQSLYEDVYCARGNMENRIKEQLEMFSDRTSCRQWWSNQFRLLLSSLAHVLVAEIRRIALKGTRLAKAQVGTIRLRLLKIAATVERNTRQVRFRMSEVCPNEDLFRMAVARLKPG